MKYIKYDEDGKQVSSKETKLNPADIPKSPVDTQLNVVTPMTRKRTIRGLAAGVILGIPVGAFAEVIRFLSSSPWDNFLTGILFFVGTLLVCTAIGYVSGSMADRD